MTKDELVQLLLDEIQQEAEWYDEAGSDQFRHSAQGAVAALVRVLRKVLTDGAEAPADGRVMTMVKIDD